MAIVSVGEKIDGRRAKATVEGLREYTRVFLVRTDNRNDGSQTVGNAAALPRPGDPYVVGNDSDPGARCASLSPVQTANPLLWEVTAEYSSKTEPAQDNPLQRPVERSFSFAQFTRPAHQDIAGLPILNSAGQYFDPPVEVDDSRPVLTFQKNQASFDTVLALNYQDAVNSDTWQGFAPRLVKVSQIAGTTKFENGIEYVEVRYEFHVRREGWRMKILNQGRMQKNGNPCLDVNNDVAADPCPLDANTGLQLAWPINTALINFREFTVYKELPFGTAFPF